MSPVLKVWCRILHILLRYLRGTHFGHQKCTFKKSKFFCLGEGVEVKNVLLKKSIFFCLGGIGLLSQSSEVECNPKMNILFFDYLGGGNFFIFLHFGRCSLLRSLGQSSEVEHNPKMNILFFDHLGGLFLFFCILVNIHHSDCSANHQKLNVIHV